MASGPAREQPSKNAKLRRDRRRRRRDRPRLRVARCAERGARVVVLERAGAAGRGDAGRGRDAGAGRRAASFGEEELLELTLAAARMLPGLRRASSRRRRGLRPGYLRTGALHVALDRDEAAELRRRHELQRSLGLEAEWLGPRACRRLEPGLHPSLNGGVHVPRRGGGRPAGAAAALLAALEAAGGEVRDRSGGRARACSPAGGCAGVRTADGRELRGRADRAGDGLLVGRPIGCRPRRGRRCGR